MSFLSACASGGYGAIGVLRKRATALAAALMLAALPAGAETLTVTALGDSLTQGRGLAQENGFVAVLEGWLQDRGHDVNVINAGVSGDTTAGGLSRIDWTLGDNPDAMIVALGGNDMLRGIDPAVSRENLDAILARIAQEEEIPVLLVGMSAPGNYGADYAEAFDAIYPDLAASYGALLHPSFLQPIEEAGPEGVARLMQDDRIHPNAEGVRRIVEAMGPKVEELLARAHENGGE